MSAAGAGAARKPVAATNGRPEHCFCTHSPEDHAAGDCSRCKCSHYRQRPCVCGHNVALHSAAAKCLDPGCQCKKFREDGSPEFLLRMGIHAGEWQFMTLPQLRWLMDPERPETVRVWACGMIHSIGQRSRQAVKIDSTGQKVPLSPADIEAELNALDPIPRLTRQNTRRALSELEEQGACRRAGRSKSKVRLFFYARPIRKIVVRSDYNAPVSGLQTSNLPDQLILRVQATVVKSFLQAVREGIKGEIDDFVVTPDYKELIEKELEPALVVVRSAYEKALIAVRSERAYKEDSSTSNKSKAAPPGKVVDESSSSSKREPIETTTSPDLQGSYTIKFSDRLSQMFAAAGKPAPTIKQVGEVAALVPESAREVYLKGLAGRVGRMQHPGALKPDAEAFAKSLSSQTEVIDHGSYTPVQIRAAKEFLSDPFEDEARKQKALALYPSLKSFRPTPDLVHKSAEERIRRAIGEAADGNPELRADAKMLLRRAEREWPELLDRIRQEDRS